MVKYVQTFKLLEAIWVSETMKFLLIKQIKVSKQN